MAMIDIFHDSLYVSLTLHFELFYKSDLTWATFKIEIKHYGKQQLNCILDI